MAELVVPLLLLSGGEVGPLAGLEEEDEGSQRPVVLRDPLDLLGGGALLLLVDDEVVGAVPLLQGGGEDLVVGEVFYGADEAVQVAVFGYHPSSMRAYGYNLLRLWPFIK